MDDCEASFREFVKFGFEFSEIGFGGNHTHFTANVPKKYSILEAETMLKSHSAKVLFQKHPNLRKRYPRGEFWSGYEHHQSTGLTDLEESNDYIRKQREHHKVNVINDKQKRILEFSA
jgi:REP element-mobilizing transposase RayT